MKPANQCKNLRTKKMFIPALAAEAFSPDNEEIGHSGHCWCACTLTETGPDDRPVGMQVCDQSRPCFEH
jgi:hypothetical protein